MLLDRETLTPAFARFMEEVDSEISEMKLSLNGRGRTVAVHYLTAVRQLSDNFLSLTKLFYSSLHKI